MGHDHGEHVRNDKQKAGNGKKIAFFSIGSLTLLYCVAELAAALYINSLTLLSDGFHNLSDVVSLYIAYWAQNAAQRDQSDAMSYGWARTEILGGLSNGCFLLSLCLYVALEAIPKLIRPTALGTDCTGEGCKFVYELFILIAASGLFLNLVGTIVFYCTGLSHGHSHSHGHGHDGHSKKKKNPDAEALLGINSGDDDHGRRDSSSDDDKHGHEHGHGHGHGDEHEHDHSHKLAKKKEKKSSGHEHGHEHGHHEGEKKKKDKKHIKQKKGKHPEKKKGMFDHIDLNMWAVFIHYLGDTVSSLFVLGTGLLLHYFRADWTLYIDPVSSLVIVVLIVTTTIPLVKRCSVILLQGVPESIDTDDLRGEIGKLDYVVSIHDLHIWQLVDGMVIASVHLLVEEGGNLGDLLYLVKRIFHQHGIHSSSIQPEFVAPTTTQPNFCAQNCVEECEEDWCCKKTADRSITEV